MSKSARKKLEAEGAGDVGRAPLAREFLLLGGNGLRHGLRNAAREGNHSRSSSVRPHCKGKRVNAQKRAKSGTPEWGKG